jgi:hypothetical protein
MRTCMLCGSLCAKTNITPDDNLKALDVCDYCYRTQAGSDIRYDHGDTHLARLVAQCFNVLEINLREAIAKGVRK